MRKDKLLMMARIIEKTFQTNDWKWETQRGYTIPNRKEILETLTRLIRIAETEKVCTGTGRIKIRYSDEDPLEILLLID